MSESKIDIKILAKDLASNVIKGVQTTTKNLGKEVSGLGSAVKDVSGKITTGATVAVAGLTAGFVAMSVSALKNADALQQNRIAFETILGSAKEAGTLLKDIKKFGLSTPFEQKDLIEGSKQLLAYGFSAKEIIPTMKSLGNISAGLGMDKLPVLIRAIGQINAKGKLMGGEMLQMNEAGLNLIPTLAKMRGVSEKVFRSKDITKWNISAKEAREAMDKLANSRFAGLMEKQSRTLSGMVSNLSDFGSSLLNTIGGINDAGELVKGGALDQMNTLVGSLLSAIDKSAPQIQAFGSSISSLIGEIISLGGGVASALLGSEDPLSGMTANIDTLTGLIRDNKASVIEFFGGIGDFFRNLDPEDVQTFSLVVGILTGLAVVVTALNSPIVLLVAGIGAFGVAVTWLTNVLKENQALFSLIAIGVGALGTAFALVAGAPLALILGAITLLSGAIIGLKSIWDNNLGGIKDKAFWLRDKIVEAFNWVKDKIFNIFDNITGQIRGTFSLLWDFFNAVKNGDWKEVGALVVKFVQLQKNGVPTAPKSGGGTSFAVGINRVPHDMVANIHKDEAVVPAKYNPFNPNAKGGSLGANVTVIVQGTIYGVDNFVATVAKGVEQGLAQKNKLARYNAL